MIFALDFCRAAQHAQTALENWLTYRHECKYKLNLVPRNTGWCAKPAKQQVSTILHCYATLWFLLLYVCYWCCCFCYCICWQRLYCCNWHASKTLKWSNKNPNTLNVHLSAIECRAPWPQQHQKRLNSAVLAHLSAASSLAAALTGFSKRAHCQFAHTSC